MSLLRERLAGVSIRSRHRCREKPTEATRRSRSWKFQSAPGIDAGRNSEHVPGSSTDAVSIRSRHRCREKRVATPHTPRKNKFQSAPGIDAGRNRAATYLGAVWGVSIRSRHRCREKPEAIPLCARCHRFQSAPGIDAGRNHVRWILGQLYLVSIRSRHRCREKPNLSKSLRIQGVAPLPARSLRLPTGNARKRSVGLRRNLILSSASNCRERWGFQPVSLGSRKCSHQTQTMSGPSKSTGHLTP